MATKQTVATQDTIAHPGTMAGADNVSRKSATAAHLCPLCEQPNQCGVATSDNGKPFNCWCSSVNFQNTAFELGSTKNRQSCICRHCSQISGAQVKGEP